jgi:Ca-activated chloride channel family protein
MVRKIPLESAVDNWQSAVASRQPPVASCQSSAKAQQRKGPLPGRCLLSILTMAMILVAATGSRADSLASKNKEGNFYFSQGKYSEAEKAYLDAQVKSPGKPEILYNLGNSLIKQEKYDQGIQALEQARERSEKELEENSWFNAGNALFLKGNYQDSAGAFMEALKLDPTDRDTKHNL